MRTAGETFETKADADRWLATLRHEVGTGEWIDPTLGELTVGVSVAMKKSPLVAG